MKKCDFVNGGAKCTADAVVLFARTDGKLKMGYCQHHSNGRIAWWKLVCRKAPGLWTRIMATPVKVNLANGSVSYSQTKTEIIAPKPVSDEGNDAWKELEDDDTNVPDDIDPRNFREEK